MGIAAKKEIPDFLLVTKRDEKTGQIVRHRPYRLFTIGGKGREKADFYEIPLGSGEWYKGIHAFDQGRKVTAAVIEHYGLDRLPRKVVPLTQDQMIAIRQERLDRLDSAIMERERALGVRPTEAEGVEFSEKVFDDSPERIPVAKHLPMPEPGPATAVQTLEPPSVPMNENVGSIEPPAVSLHEAAQPATEVVSVAPAPAPAAQTPEEARAQLAAESPVVTSKPVQTMKPSGGSFVDSLKNHQTEIKADRAPLGKDKD